MKGEVWTTRRDGKWVDTVGKDAGNRSGRTNSKLNAFHFEIERERE